MSRMKSTQNAILLIGFGNDLLGDDAAGPRVAAEVEGWKLPELSVQIRHQLTPELSEGISEARAVIFVDASLDAQGDLAECQAIQPSLSSNLIGHCGEPGALLGLAETIYGRCPPAWMVHIPASNFELGAPVSDATERAIHTALEQIRALYDELKRAEA